ncbi:radical SAM protein [bacterium]|nr:radical SAM protein [bacterium]
MFDKLLNTIIPGQLVIQYTDHCNAKCPQCGMRISNKYARTRMGDASVHAILKAASRRGLKIISFTGGEPMMFPDELVRFIHAARQYGIKHIRTGTNGFIFCGWQKNGYIEKIEKFARILSRTPLRNFWISLDSYLPDVHESMRGLPGVVEGIRRALPIFHAYGIYPSVNLGLNRNLAGDKTYTLRPDGFSSREEYLKAFQKCYVDVIAEYFAFAVQLGFTMSSICFPMCMDSEKSKDGLAPVYQATSSDWVVNYQSDEKAALFDALLRVVPQYRRLIRHFTPLSSLYALREKYRGTLKKMHPCLGGIRYFFVSARDGHVYPCGYREKDDMGRLENRDWKADSWDADCNRCDWECFRDPSEMLGPIIDMLRRPLSIATGPMADRLYRRYWLKDWKYYIQTGFFHGRKPFKRKQAAAHSAVMKERMDKIGA